MRARFLEPGSTTVHEPTSSPARRGSTARRGRRCAPTAPRWAARAADLRRGGSGRRGRRGRRRHPRPPEVARPGHRFGLAPHGFHAAKHVEYLADVRERLPLYRDQGIAHPGWILRDANYVLSPNVRLGPWIHVESVVQHHGGRRGRPGGHRRGHVTRSGSTRATASCGSTSSTSPTAGRWRGRRSHRDLPQPPTRLWTRAGVRLHRWGGQPRPRLAWIC